MSATVIILGFIYTILIAIAVVLIVRRSAAPHSDAGAALLLKEDLNRLSDDITKFKDGLQVQLTERLDRNQELMRDSVVKQFDASSKLIADVTERLVKLDETNKRVVNVADELRTLQNVLTNPKQRGVLGEYYLTQVLENVLPPDRFKLQYKLCKDAQGRDLICDAVILLDKGRMLPVDSKFSLENYNRLVEEKDKTQREILEKSFKTDLKNRIDETSKYIMPGEGTMDYAFMFIPSEAIYYDLLVNKVGAAGVSTGGLIEYAFREKRVIIVSPTTFMAYLQTVLQGLRSLQIEEQAKEIQKRVGELGRHIIVYQQLMQKLGTSLGTSVGHFNTAHQELRKIDKDVVRIAGTASSVETMTVERPMLDE